MRRAWAGSIVRGVLLAGLLVVVAPAIVRDGDVLASPAVALMLFGATAVAILSLAYRLATVGAPGEWLSYRLRLTADRLLIAASAIAAGSCAIGLSYLRSGINDPHSPLAQFDLRASGTAVRLAGEFSLMQTLNSAGIRSMLVLGGMLVLAAIAAGAFRSAALLAATMAVGGVLVEFLKLTPPSPAAVFSDGARASSSWPSGHAALQGSLALGFILWWWAAGLPRPSIVAALVVPLAILVGYSRAYLSIHYLSEVLAGWLVATMAAALVLALDRLVVPRLGVPSPIKRWPVVAAGVAALIVTGVAVHSVHRFHDRGPREHFAGLVPDTASGDHVFPVPSKPALVASAEPATVLDPLPEFSETLLGRHVQPIGLVVVATADEMRAALGTLGWSSVAPVTPKRLAPDFWSGISGGMGRDAPVAPTFFDTRPADLVLVHPARSHGVAGERAEVWELPAETPSGCAVWAVTAARDSRTSWAWHTLFPERHIDPAIDTERDALARSLTASGGLDDAGRFDFVAPGPGRGPAGSYVTDGKVALLRQRACVTP